MTTDPEVAEVADVAAAPGDARAATTRLLARGAWSFVVSGLLSMASSFVDESVARYL
ncbi:MAG: hypothetical protein H6835_20985, partial [Planctomycetes bacterium]|nr:hypothetical protein [Planctomycetota bacterium]